MFESYENTVMSAAILYLSFCVCDVMNKVGMCDRKINYVMSPLFFFLFFIGKERTTVPAPPKDDQLSLRSILVCIDKMNHTVIQHADGAGVGVEGGEGVEEGGCHKEDLLLERERKKKGPRATYPFPVCAYFIAPT